MPPHCEANELCRIIRSDMKYKRLADQDLYARKALRWTILRPGHLSDEGSDGKCQLGQVQLGKVVRATYKPSQRRRYTY